uniref:Uncharacterized protein n=1 Tax=Lepeophtheirus salmonis TaxID=72036 RepID=A0A0K2VFA9_LEPSM
MLLTFLERISAVWFNFLEKCSILQFNSATYTNVRNCLGVEEGLWMVIADTISVNNLKFCSSNAHIKCLMLSLIASNSLSKVEYFFCVSDKVLDQNASGCQGPFTFCSRTAPIPVSDASVIRAKGNELSRKKS